VLDRWFSTLQLETMPRFDARVPCRDRGTMIALVLFLGAASAQPQFGAGNPFAPRAPDGGKVVKPFVFKKIKYPPREPCNASALWEARCAPVDAKCEEERTVNTKHGIGNALMTTYRAAAKEVLEKGCTPVLKEGTGAFHLQDFVHKPARVPANIQSGSCITWALTQPRANLQAVVDSARGDGAVPTVAIHVRTGYVDVIARPREKVVWDRLECPADDGRGPLDGHDELRRRRLAAVDAGALVATPAAALSEVTVRVARDADRAYGARGWDLYVASDAPGVRRWVTEKLQGRARNIRHLNGTIGHNYFQGQGGAASQGGDAHVQALADLILLSEAHVVAYYDSKFPVIAAERTFCPGLRLPVKGYPRHALATIIKTKDSDDLAKVDNAWRCRDLGAKTVKECQCLYKTAYS